jgi:hypothetical protein
MTRRTTIMLAGTTAAMLAASLLPATAMTMHECSIQYRAAKAAGALKGTSWNEFRRTQCAAGAAGATGAATTTSAPAPAPSAAWAGSTVFPTAISPKYAGQSAGKARMRTCLDQYRANKAANRNGGLSWIAKGGGYYSQCNKRLGGR